MDNLRRLKKQSIRATDIASQYWCERQMEFNYLYGKEITAEQKKGSDVHKEMEEKTNVPVVLQTKSYADFMYKILYTSVLALETLLKNGKSREIQVYGMINGFPVVGKMDMLELKEGESFIWEDKTKANDNLPTEPQLLTHKIQVMLYKKLLEDIRSGRYPKAQFRSVYGTARLIVTPEFVRQLDALGIKKEMQTVDSLVDTYFDAMTKLAKISDTLHIRYINQFTGKEIKVYRFQYDPQSIESSLEFVLKYWKGEREALPVPEAEKWKCNYCVFFGNRCTVWWPQKTLQ